MNGSKKENRKKGGFWAPLGNIFGGGSAGGGAAGIGGAASGMGGLSGLLATKAGLVGVILGAATIAAGVGVVYNYLGSSSKPAYGPNLFQDSYYAEQAGNAGLERARQKESEAGSSTLDLFRQQAKKDGLGLAGEGNAPDGAAAASPEAEAVGGAADGGVPAPGGGSADSAAGAPGGGKIQSAFGFSAKGLSAGGSGNMPKLSGGGGMFDGIGKKFSPVYRPQGGQGKASAMKGSLASVVRSSPKYAVPNFNKKGAFGQAKFAGKMGNKAAYSADGAGARTSAAAAFSGETAGAGDASGGAGVGLGGSGVSDGMQLKNNDPNLDASSYTPPPAGDAENVSPWKKYTDMAMYAMIAGAILIVLANQMTKRAKALAANPATMAQAKGLYMIAILLAVMAMGAAGIVIYAGMTVMNKFGQKWTGIAYMLAGGALIMKAYQAITTAQDGMKSGEKVSTEATDSGLGGAENALGSMASTGGNINQNPTGGSNNSKQDATE
jgi:hypothetical protein